MSLRTCWRAVTLLFLLILCILRSIPARMRREFTLIRRAEWLQLCARVTVKHLGITLRVYGKLPDSGILVSNHLSYLDIVIFAATLPCYFVSKAEVNNWPLFGFLARSGGTLFVNRSSRASAAQVTEQIEERLRLSSVPILFFPEGTSTNGSRVLRFNSRFFEPAVTAQVPITAAAIRYSDERGTPESKFCWYGDADFLPHVWALLKMPRFTAEIHFAESRVYADRRTAAEATQQDVEEFRDENVTCAVLK